MVIKANERSAKKPAKQGIAEDTPEPIKINGSTHFDFEGKNLTAYGGLLPVATMLEKLKFQELVEETLTVKRVTRAMPWYQFVLSMVLALYVGFSRLHQLRFLARDPLLVGILQVLRLPPQCTFWRFLASLHLTVAQQLLEVQRQMRQRVWEAANVKLTSVTLDTALRPLVQGTACFRNCKKSWQCKGRWGSCCQPASLCGIAGLSEVHRIIRK